MWGTLEIQENLSSGLILTVLHILGCEYSEKSQNQSDILQYIPY